MLIHRGGRFYCGNASFRLPDGCAVIPDENNFLHNGLKIQPPDGQFTVEIDFSQHSVDFESELLKIVETGYDQKGISEPKPVRYAHAEGWEISYPSMKQLLHEIWLEVNRSCDFGETEPINVLALLITSDICRDIEEIKCTQLFRDLADGILAE